MRPFLIAMFLLFSGTARAQEPPAPIIVHPAPTAKPPEPVGEFTKTPPDITLIPHGDRARHGRVWVRSVGDGLLIAGKMEGGEPVFPKDKNEILSKDHIEIWLATSTDVEMPEVGWANYWGETLLPKGSISCADWQPVRQGDNDTREKCREWADRQLRYRRSLKRLFVRQWVVAPGFSIESFATPAYHELLTRFGGENEVYVNDGPKLLKPRGDVRTWITNEGSGYSFQVFVPFSALPPLPWLKLSELRLMVDVFGPAPTGKKTGAYSTSSPARIYGDPKTFNALRLDSPVNYRLTPCNLPLLGTDKREELSEDDPTHDAWFVPSTNPESPYESEIFILINDINSSRYEPSGLSPGIRLTHYFWNNVGPEEWVCGPPLSYQNHRQFERFPFVVSKEGFSTRRLADGDLLVRTGPRVYNWGSQGQCGACPYTQLKIFDLRKDAKLFGALGLGDQIDGSSLISQDFNMSPDWSEVTQYDKKTDGDGEPGPWSSTTYCLAVDTKQYETSVHVYKPCGHKDNVQPPNPPVLKELRDWQN
jgi:hypothetical protein